LISITKAVASVTSALLLALPLSATAEPAVPGDPRYVFQTVGQDFGLGTRTVVALAQDGQGFIWIGTLNGLFRYDGADVIEWGEADGLPNPYIIQIAVGPQGRVWVVTLGGIARFDGARFVPVRIDVERDPKAMKRPERQRLAFGASGDAYVASPAGLIRLAAGDCSLARVWGKRDGLPDDDIYAVQVAADGDVWFGGEFGVGKLDPDSGKVELVPIGEGVPGDQVKAILSDAKGTAR
jgi:ligand-binding sensor domain-containing protein